MNSCNVECPYIWLTSIWPSRRLLSKRSKNWAQCNKTFLACKHLMPLVTLFSQLLRSAACRWMEGRWDRWVGVREGIPVRCGMLCAALELVTMRKKKSQFIFFITLLCLKDSAQMHVGSVLVLALIRNCSVKKTSSWCTTSVFSCGFLSGVLFEGGWLLLGSERFSLMFKGCQWTNTWQEKWEQTWVMLDKWMFSLFWYESH